MGWLPGAFGALSEFLPPWLIVTVVLVGLSILAADRLMRLYAMLVAIRGSDTRSERALSTLRALNKAEEEKQK